MSQTTPEVPEFFADFDVDPGPEQPAEVMAEAPAPALEAAAPVQAQAAAEPAPEADRTVPLATLIEERKRLQAQIDEERARNARFEKLQEEIRALRERAQPAPVAEPEPPKVDYLEDPKGYTDQQVGQVVKQLKDLTQQATVAQQTAQQVAMRDALVRTLAQAEQEFVTQTPDYFDALQHFRSARAAQLQVVYPQATAAQLRAHMENEELQTAAQLLHEGRNPAAIAYQLATALGYRKQEAQNQQQAAANAAPAQAAQTSKVADLEARRRAQGMGSAAAQGNTDSELEQLMAAEPDEFDAALAEMFGRR